MSICPGCGGVVGRDCFNPAECQWIAEDMAQREREPEYSEEEYCAGYGHPFYGTLPDGTGRCLCGQRVYPAQMDSWERRAFLSLLRRDLEVAEEAPWTRTGIGGRRDVLIAGDLFWAVWRYNARGRTGPPPSDDARRHAERVSGRRP